MAIRLGRPVHEVLQYPPEMVATMVEELSSRG